MATHWAKIMADEKEHWFSGEFKVERFGDGVHVAPRVARVAIGQEVEYIGRERSERKEDVTQERASSEQVQSCDVIPQDVIPPSPQFSQSSQSFNPQALQPLQAFAAIHSLRETPCEWLAAAEYYHSAENPYSRKLTVAKSQHLPKIRALTQKSIDCL